MSTVSNPVRCLFKTFPKVGYTFDRAFQINRSVISKRRRRLVFARNPGESWTKTRGDAREERRRREGTDRMTFLPLFPFLFFFFLTLDESLFSSRVLSNSDLSSLYYVSLEPVSDIVSRSGLCLE